MLETSGDLWGWYPHCQAKVITTNGYINRYGEAVMGRGTAQQAAARWPELPAVLGKLLKDNGNHVASLGRFSYNPAQERHLPADIIITTPPFELVAMPVKEHWSSMASLELITRSCEELSSLADHKGWTNIILVRPGCGNGQLDWATVRPVVASLLDNRFTVVQLYV